MQIRIENLQKLLEKTTNIDFMKTSYLLTDLKTLKSMKILRLSIRDWTKNKFFKKS